MQNGPRDVQRRTNREVQGVEQVVPADYDQPQAAEDGSRQPDQCREGNHADADRPDHLQVNHGGRELEGPGEIHQGELQHHQEQATLEQEGRHGVLALVLFTVPKRGQAREQNEHRRT
ncbi:hypothetical protein D3C84_767590 [compost metagenome]